MCACVRAFVRAHVRALACLRVRAHHHEGAERLSPQRRNPLVPEIGSFMLAGCGGGLMSYAMSHQERCGVGSDTFNVHMIRVSPAVVGSEGQKAISSYGLKP